MDITNIRYDFKQSKLTRCDLNSDPVKQFEQWLQQAKERYPKTFNVIYIATASKGGEVNNRTVLLRDFGPDGFIFYTNYNSRKGEQLAQNPNISLLLSWLELERQIEITGVVEKLPPEQSDLYFQSRPRGSQLGAWCSEQSKTIPSRKILDQCYLKLEEQYRNKPIPRPPHWGGYRVTPKTFEFWQGGEKRLHNRFIYRLNSSRLWIIERLAP